MIVISYRTTAIIDLKKLKENCAAVRNVVSPKTKICAVVKADAYGHGGVEISRALENHVDYFAVALAEEAVELRLCGVEKPVLLLLPTDDDGIIRAIRFGFCLSADSVSYLGKIQALAEKYRAVVGVHIALNTGMNRFGFELSELIGALKYIKKFSNISVKGVFSHFYMPENDDETEKQFTLFQRGANIVRDAFPGVIRHVAASGGILAGRRYDLDMVRPGLLLYGYKPFESVLLDVKPVMRVEAQTIRNVKLKRGDRLFYGDYGASEDCVARIVRAGYADGLRRKGDFTLNNRCMDVSAIRGEGDGRVIVMDDAQKHARAENTIAYEILCGVTHRANVVYKE